VGNTSETHTKIGGDYLSIDTIVGIIILVLAAAAIIWFGVVKKVPAVQRMALALVIEAERRYGSGTGRIKYATVVGELYIRLPWLLKIFVTDTMIDELIESAVTYMKENLDGEKIRASS